MRRGGSHTGSGAGRSPVGSAGIGAAGSGLSRHSAATCSSTGANCSSSARDPTDSWLAFASTSVLSANNWVPATKPASRHWRTISVKKAW